MHVQSELSLYLLGGLLLQLTELLHREIGTEILTQRLDVTLGLLSLGHGIHPATLIEAILDFLSESFQGLFLVDFLRGVYRLLLTVFDRKSSARDL